MNSRNTGSQNGDIFSFEEAAVYLGVSETILTELLASGIVPAAKISKGWVIRRADLDGFLQDQIERQTTARREAVESGVPAKVPTAYGEMVARRAAAAPPRRRRGFVPPLPLHLPAPISVTCKGSRK